MYVRGMGDMEEHPIDDQTIIRYLLNDLSEPEQIRFEELYIADHRIFEQVRVVEEELIEDYARGRLSAHQRAQFERHYLATTGRRKKVEFIEDMIEALAAKPPSPLPVESKRVSWWRSLIFSMRRQKMVIGFALTTIALMA